MEDDERSASLGKYKCRRKHHDYQSNDNGDNRPVFWNLFMLSSFFIRESICFDISILPQFMTNAQIHHVNSPQIQCKQYLNNFNRYTYSTESRTNYHKMQRWAIKSKTITNDLRSYGICTLHHGQFMVYIVTPEIDPCRDILFTQKPRPKVSCPWWNSSSQAPCPVQMIIFPSLNKSR